MKKLIFIILIAFFIFGTISVDSFQKINLEPKNKLVIATSNIKLSTDQKLSQEALTNLIEIITKSDKYLGEYIILLQDLGYVKYGLIPEPDNKDFNLPVVSGVVPYFEYKFYTTSGEQVHIANNMILIPNSSGEPVSISENFILIPNILIENLSEHPANYGSDLFEAIVADIHQKIFSIDGYTEKTASIAKKLTELKLKVMYDITTSYLVKETNPIKRSAIMKEFNSIYGEEIGRLSFEYKIGESDTTSIYSKAAQVAKNRPNLDKDGNPINKNILDLMPGFEDLVEYLNDKESVKTMDSKN